MLASTMTTLAHAKQETASKNVIALFVETAVLAPAYCTTATIVRHLPKDTAVQVFCVDFSETDFALAQRAFRKLHPAVKLTLVDSGTLFGGLVERSANLGMGVWGRLFLDRLLPRELSRVLYLDCDMLVYRDLAELFELKFPAGCAFAACADQGSHVDGNTARFRTEIGLSADGSFFNSGLLLMDWQRLISTGILREIRTANAKRPDLAQHRFADQNIFNIMLDGDWCKLDPRWNMQTRLLQLLPGEKPWLAHFCGKSKPWHANCDASISRFTPVYWQLISTAPELLPYSALTRLVSLQNRLRGKWYPTQTALDALLARSCPWAYRADVRTRVMDRPKRRQRAARRFAELVNGSARQKQETDGT
ncbi:MAG: glycosyltransferase family 8 protein [Anderseniella sp.]